MNAKLAKQVLIAGLVAGMEATGTTKAKDLTPSKVYERKEPALPGQSTRVRKTKTKPRNVRRR